VENSTGFFVYPSKMDTYQKLFSLVDKAVFFVHFQKKHPIPGEKK
jgi:hypothetical protein